jgi:hypothetical protein
MYVNMASKEIRWHGEVERVMSIGTKLSEGVQDSKMGINDGIHELVCICAVIESSVYFLSLFLVQQRVIRTYIPKPGYVPVSISNAVASNPQSFP